MTSFFDSLPHLAALHSAEGLRSLIQSGGLAAVLLILFAETGLLIGFFLPGDSLLVTAGIFASASFAGSSSPPFSIFVLLPCTLAAAVIGDQLGYWLGRQSGPSIFRREDGFFFRKRHLQQAHAFYEQNGARALILARFVPIFRTFVPFTAGIAKMNYRKFFACSLCGGILWTQGLVLVGYFLGKTPLADELHKVIMIVVVISTLPLLIGAWKRLRARQVHAEKPI